MSMELQESVVQMRGILAPHLDEYSLELLDVEIEEKDWDTAYGMAVETAAFHRVEIPGELLQVA